MILFNRGNRRWGLLVLAIWLIIQGLELFLEFNISPKLMAVLAIAAGVLILLDR